MQAPQILPWVAQQAGISEQLALKLWRRAASEAELRLGTCQSPEYHRLARETFLSLADDESSNPDCQLSPRFTWAWQQQQRLSRLSMQVWQKVWLDWNPCWQDEYKELS